MVSEAHKQRQKRYRERVRKDVLSAYGDKCNCCGEINIEFLTLDHINGKGNQHRKEIGNSVYRWIEQNNYPPGFQVLCMNCNFSLGVRGYCPHKPKTI